MAFCRLGRQRCHIPRPTSSVTSSLQSTPYGHNSSPPRIFPLLPFFTFIQPTFPLTSVETPRAGTLATVFILRYFVPQQWINYPSRARGSSEVTDISTSYTLNKLNPRPYASVTSDVG